MNVCPSEKLDGVWRSEKGDYTDYQCIFLLCFQMCHEAGKRDVDISSMVCYTVLWDLSNSLPPLSSCHCHSPILLSFSL